ncbi:MAG: putative sugar nucleotidyl transferase [Saprospiraceae bacterium]
MNCILLDPLSTKQLWPISATRPISGIRIGLLTIEEKWSRYLDSNVSHLCRNELSNLFPINLSEDNIIISGKLLPDSDFVQQLTKIKLGELAIDKDGQFVQARLNRAEAIELIEFYFKDQLNQFIEKRNSKLVTTPNVLEFPWQIFQWNGEEIRKDFQLVSQGRKSALISPTNQLIGNNIFLEEGSKMECCILNSTDGPIYIGSNAEVMEGSMIRGPFALCNNGVLKLGSKVYGPTTIGPFCKVGGEVNNSVFQANSNKAHDGFIGNSVIGEWCNIGADSNNSNLKNTYTEVKLWNYSSNNFIKTASIFCGLIMGDHSKCGINTMFNTGTVVGVGANIYGSGFPRQFIPDFSWGGASGFTTFKLKEFFETATAVMSRRNKALDQNHIELLSQIYKNTSSYRSWEKEGILETKKVE